MTKRLADEVKAEQAAYQNYLKEKEDKEIERLKEEVDQLRELNQRIEGAFRSVCKDYEKDKSRFANEIELLREEVERLQTLLQNLAEEMLGEQQVQAIRDGNIGGYVSATILRRSDYKFDAEAWERGMRGGKSKRFVLPSPVTWNRDAIEVLQWYANEDIYGISGATAIHGDNGERARETLRRIGIQGEGEATES